MLITYFIIFKNDYHFLGAVIFTIFSFRIKYYLNESFK